MTNRSIRNHKGRKCEQLFGTTGMSNEASPPPLLLTKPKNCHQWRFSGFLLTSAEQKELMGFQQNSVGNIGTGHIKVCCDFLSPSLQEILHTSFEDSSYILPPNYKIRTHVPLTTGICFFGLCHLVEIQRGRILTASTEGW